MYLCFVRPIVARNEQKRNEKPIHQIIYISVVFPHSSLFAWSAATLTHIHIYIYHTKRVPNPIWAKKHEVELLNVELRIKWNGIQPEQSEEARQHQLWLDIVSLNATVLLFSSSYWRFFRSSLFWIIPSSHIFQFQNVNSIASLTMIVEFFLKKRVLLSISLTFGWKLIHQQTKKRFF